MTSVIHFIIYFPPDCVKDVSSQRSFFIESKMNEILLKLGFFKLAVKSHQVIDVKKGLPIPDIVGSEVSVQAECPCHLKNAAYQMLIAAWNEIIQSDSTKNMPLLMLSETGAFPVNISSQHCNVHCSGLEFGVMPFASTFVSYSKNVALNNEISLDFSHDEKKIEIRIVNQVMYGMVNTLSGHSIIRTSYDDICKILVKQDGFFDHIYLIMLQPPLLYMAQPKFSKDGFRYENINRMRELECLPAYVIGKVNVLHITLQREKSSEIINCLHYRCNQLPVFYGHISDSPSSVPDSPHLHFSYFSCRYMFCAILSRNFCITEQIKRESLLYPAAAIHWHSNSYFTSEKFLEKSLIDIFYAVDCGYFVNFRTALTALYAFYSTCDEEESFLHNLMPVNSYKIRRAIITPTRLLLWPPEIMFTNRFLRNFNPDFALKVNFRDDNITRLSFDARHVHEGVYLHTVRYPLTNGLDIAGRYYQFLGWSNSQLRDHSVWMYAQDDKAIGVNEIRRWIGDFSHIHSVPKYMSRMGQAFSQTEDTISVPLNENCIRTEPDIQRGCDPNGKAYCFSDGVGKISVSLAKKVQDALGHDKCCSAFQIRYGGYKGMLVTDPMLKDADIVFRESMKKFDSPNQTRLEIARTSGPVPLMLNRPFITILEQMGVRRNVFLQLQEKMLRTLTDMLVDEKKAASCLRSKLPFHIFNAEDIAGCGMSLCTEPFFRALLLAIHRQSIGNLKSKANIDIDPSKSRNMLGVLDETSKLQYGQVFVQYTTDITDGQTTKNTTIIEGTVLVTKNPCMHPGDVRKFQAVDIPELHHVIDCIVFPQNGPRPHPNEMAGSDLDGDEYAVLWHKDLIFSRNNEVPAHFPSLAAPKNSCIMDENVISFLIDYIKNGEVGVIANAHLSHADSERLGIFSPLCMSVAKKFSVAIDFAKTGVSTTHFHLERHERVESFPDFMEKFWKSTYRSKRVLGKLYRICKDFESENQHASLNYNHVKADPILEVIGWQKYRESAIKSRDKYNSLLSFIFKNHGVQHESEAFSGAFSKLHCRHHEKNDKANLGKIIVASLKTLCSKMKREFLEEFSESSYDVKELESEIWRKASAWYMVTYENPNPTFLSFPWIVSKYLVNIRMRAHRQAMYSPLLTKLDASIYASVAAGILEVVPTSAVKMFDLYKIICGREVLESAFRFIMHWAVDMGIVYKHCNSTKGIMDIEKLLLIFLFVAERENYILPKTESLTEPQVCTKSAAALFLAFLRHCSKFRFCDKKDTLTVLPFTVYKNRRLGKTAIQTYHQFAITGMYHIFDQPGENNVYDMKPVYIDCPDVAILNTGNVRKITDALHRYSGVTDICLRQIMTTKKIIVSACGTRQSLHLLRQVLRKGHDAFRVIMQTGFVDIS